MKFVGKIEFSKYAELQTKEREIKKQDIADTLKSPGQILLGKGGRKVAQKKLDRGGQKGLLRVIFEERADGCKSCNNCLLDIEDKKILEVNMKVKYDEQVDILYIRLKETPYHESDEIKEGFIVDYDKDGNVIGIEILDVSEYLSSDELATVRFDVSRAIAQTG